jgi:hypothetical protein
VLFIFTLLNLHSSYHYCKKGSKEQQQTMMDNNKMLKALYCTYFLVPLPLTPWFKGM